MFYDDGKACPSYPWGLVRELTQTLRGEVVRIGGAASQKCGTPRQCQTKSLRIAKFHRLRSHAQAGSCCCVALRSAELLQKVAVGEYLGSTQEDVPSGITPPSATVSSAATSRTVWQSIGKRSSISRPVMPETEIAASGSLQSL